MGRTEKTGTVTRRLEEQRNQPRDSLGSSSKNKAAAKPSNNHNKNIHRNHNYSNHSSSNNNNNHNHNNHNHNNHNHTSNHTRDTRRQ